MAYDEQCRRASAGAGRGLAVVLIVAVVSVGACSGGSDDPTAGLTPTSLRDGVESTPPTAPRDDSDDAVSDVEEGPVLGGETVISVDDDAPPGAIRALVRSIPVDVQVRYAGFGIVVETVDLGFDPAGFAVAYVTMAMTNDTNRDDKLQTAVEIASNGHVAGIDRDFTPTVPSGGTAQGAVSIRLDRESFGFDDAMLLIGRPDRARVEIPIGASGELIDRLSEQHPAGASAADEVSTVSIDEVVTAWDSAEPRGQADPGSMFLHLVATLDSTVETAIGDRSIELILADGSIVPAEGVTIGRVAVGEPYVVMAGFVISDPPDGGYVLRYTERFDRGVVDVPFTID